jgi:hypothetical protein
MNRHRPPAPWYPIDEPVPPDVADRYSLSKLADGFGEW